MVLVQLLLKYHVHRFLLCGGGMDVESFKFWTRRQQKAKRLSLFGGCLCVVVYISRTTCADDGIVRRQRHKVTGLQWITAINSLSDAVERRRTLKWPISRLRALQ